MDLRNPWIAQIHRYFNQYLTIVEKSEFTDLIKGIFITEWLIIYQRFLSTFCEKDRARAV